MKIIEKNNSVLLGICPNCLSKFTLEVYELIYLYSYSDIRGVKCPVCSDEVTTSNIEKVSIREVKKIIESNSKDSDISE